MTPENVHQQLFQEAMTSNDLDLVVDVLGRADLDLDWRDVTHDMETPAMQLCHSSLSDAAMASPALLDILRVRRPDVNLQDALGRTLAMHACIGLRPEVLRCVWSRREDVDVSVCDRTGRNVFHYGACSGSEEVMELLLGHTEARSALRVLDFKGYSPLDLARQVKAQAIVKRISQTLSGGNTNTASTTHRQPLKPFFKSSPSAAATSSSPQHGLATATAATTKSKDFSKVPKSRNANRGDETSRRTLENSEYSNESEYNHFDRRSRNGASGLDDDDDDEENGDSPSSSLTGDEKSPLGPVTRPRFRSGAPHSHTSVTDTRSGLRNRSDLLEKERLQHDAEYSDPSQRDSVTDERVLTGPSSNHKKLSALSPRGGATGAKRNNPLRNSDENSGMKSPQLTANQNQLTSHNNDQANQQSSQQDSLSVTRKSLAPVVSPRRKINLDMDVETDSTEMTSPSSHFGHRSTNANKTRQVITELKPDPRRQRHLGRQSPKRDTSAHSNDENDPRYPSSRPSMILPLKNSNSNQILRRGVKGLKASEADNLNALLSPQQPHKRLLFKRQRDMREAAKNFAPGVKISEQKKSGDGDDTSSYQDEDSLFEEEISLDSSLSSSGGQGREQHGRKSSLSLPDLRDMTGCLVTSQNASPFPEEEGSNVLRVNNIVTNSGDDFLDKSPMFHYSADEDEDDGDDNEGGEDNDDDAVLEDDLSDDCIEDCFNDDINHYTDLYKRKDESKGERSQRPLPAIVNTAPAPRKGKSKPLLKS